MVSSTGSSGNKRPAAKHYPAVAEVVSVSTKKAPQQSWEDDDTIYSLEVEIYCS